MDGRVVDAIRWFRSTALLLLRQRAFERPVLSTSSALRDYLRVDMGPAVRERFRTLYLNAANELLLDDETTGTVDRAPFYVREIVGRAIELGATSLIVAHNHPSGDGRPSASDLDATLSLIVVCQAIGVTVLDHLIVSGRDVVSMRSAGHLNR